MGNIKSLLISTATCVALATGVASAADDIEVPADVGDTTVLFGGASFKEDSQFYYLGGIYAPEGLGQDGYAIKGFAGGGQFEWDAEDTSIYLGAEGDSLTFDLLLGYRMFSGDWQFGIYGGVNYWHYDQDCIINPVNPAGCNGFPVIGAPATQQVFAIGEEWGAKVEAELTHRGDFYADFRGSYSTAFDTYWSRARIGMDFGGVIIGPEGGFQGNVDYEESRVGGFALIDMGDYNLSISGGVADGTGTSSVTPVSGENSVYGAIGISTTY